MWGSIQLEYATAPTTVGAWTNSAGQGLRQDCALKWQVGHPPESCECVSTPTTLGEAS